MSEVTIGSEAPDTAFPRFKNGAALEPQKCWKDTVLSDGPEIRGDFLYMSIYCIYIYLYMFVLAAYSSIAYFKTECFEHVEHVPKQKVHLLAIFFQHEGELFKYFPFSILPDALIKRILSPYCGSKFKVEALGDLFCKLMDFG